MNKKIFIKLFVISIYIFAFKSVSFGENESIYKHYITTQKTDIKLFSYETAQVIAAISKDVRVKTLCSNENWLLVDIKYANLSAESLDDLNISIRGWALKKDFRELYLDEKLIADIDIKLSTGANTFHYPKNIPVEIISKNKWKKEKKFYLPLHSTGSDLYLLPNIIYKDHKTAIIAFQTPFVITTKALDWQKQEWMEIVFHSSGSKLQRLWVKKVEVISEDEKKLKEELFFKKEQKYKEEKRIKNLEKGVEDFLEGFGQKM